MPHERAAGGCRRQWVVALSLRDRKREHTSGVCRCSEVTRQINAPLLIALPVAERQGYLP